MSKKKAPLKGRRLAKNKKNSRHLVVAPGKTVVASPVDVSSIIVELETITGAIPEIAALPGVEVAAEPHPVPVNGFTCPAVPEEKSELEEDNIPYLEQFEDLSAHEIALLEKAVPYAKGFSDETGELPRHEDMRRFLHCKDESAKRILHAIRDGELLKKWAKVPKRHENLVAKALLDAAVGETQYQTTEEYHIREKARLLRALAKAKLDGESNKKVAAYLAKNHAGYDDLLADVKTFVKTLGNFTLPNDELIRAQQPQHVPPVGAEHSEDAVLLLSDTHFGDEIRREDTSGFPEFNLPISGNRFGYVIRKAKQVLSLHRAMYPIKRLYVWVGGDIGNGVLHDSPNSNSLFIPAQIHFGASMFKFAINDLLKLTEPDANGIVVVEEIVLLFTVGNHMRMDIHMPHKYQAQRTFDWLIYQTIIETFQGHPKVTIHSEMSPYIFENIRGHRHLFAHGMQVGYRNSPDEQCKSMGGFIQRVRGLFDSPEYRRKAGLEGETFARVCIGDIHIPVKFPRLISNGSLNGQNELGVNWVLEPIPAGQQIFGVSEKHLETWSYFLECTQIQDAPEDFNNYGIFAREYAKKIGRC